MEAVAPRQRLSSATIGEILFRKPYEFSFVQTVSLVQQLFPSKQKVGESERKEDEAINFVSRINYGLPGSENYLIKYSDNQPLQLEVNFIGLSGPQGPLPQPYGELIHDLVRGKNTALKEFLDIFNHRLTSLSYKAATRIAPLAAREHPQNSLVGKILEGFAGLRTDGLVEAWSVPHPNVLSFAQILWQRPHSLAGLETLIGGFFNITANTRAFEGDWNEIPEKYRTQIGAARYGRNNKLGVDSFIGTKIWNPTNHISVILGPLPLHKYLSFLPNGAAHKKLLELIRLYVGADTQYRLFLKLENEELPKSYLQSLYQFPLEKQQDAKLGWTSFLQRGLDTSSEAQVYIETSE